jgi:thymidylate kinase
MVYLEKLHRVLSNSDGATVLLLDQGPVFWLAYLHAFGFEGIRDQSLTLWWTRMIADWASVLDVILWVDAQDAVLLERIRNRSKWHRVQDMSEQEAYELLARYRKAYRQVISRLTSGGGPRVHSFFTDQEPLEQIVDKILNELRPGRGMR